METADPENKSIIDKKKSGDVLDSMFQILQCEQIYGVEAVLWCCENDDILMRCYNSKQPKRKSKQMYFSKNQDGVSYRTYLVRELKLNVADTKFRMPFNYIYACTCGECDGYDLYVNPHLKQKFDIHDNYVLQDILLLNSNEINFDLVKEVTIDALNEIQKSQNNDYSNVVEDVCSIVNKAFCLLGKQNSKYKDCKINHIGSMADGTKIGDPDEFDFLIEFSSSVNLPEYNFCLLSDFYRKAFYEVKFALEEITLSLDVFEFGTIHENSGKTFTYLLLCKKAKYNNMPIFIDISLCFQSAFYASYARGKLLDKLEESKPEIVDQTQKQSFSYDKILYRIGETNEKISFSLQEKDLWLNLPKEDGRKLTYHITKYVISKYMVQNYNETYERLEPYIPSYWVKTILYYLMIIYPKDRQWDHGLIHIRFLEIVFLLKVCIRMDSLISFFELCNLVPALSASAFKPVEDHLYSFIDWLTTTESKAKDFKKRITDIKARNEYKLHLLCHLSMCESYVLVTAKLHSIHIETDEKWFKNELACKVEHLKCISNALEIFRLEKQSIINKIQN